MKVGFLSAAALCLGVLLTVPRGGAFQAATPASTLEVHLNYKGAGTVDDKHKLYAVLWDSPDFVSGQAMPVELQSSADKHGALTFSNVKASPAYVSAVYDSKGEWDGQSGPPPEGSPLGLYSKTPGKPEPIDVKPGKTVSVELSFDDTVKMQAGGPGK